MNYLKKLFLMLFVSLSFCGAHLLGSVEVDADIKLYLTEGLDKHIEDVKALCGCEKEFLNTQYASYDQCEKLKNRVSKSKEILEEKTKEGLFSQEEFEILNNYISFLEDNCSCGNHEIILNSLNYTLENILCFLMVRNVDGASIEISVEELEDKLKEVEVIESYLQKGNSLGYIKDFDDIAYYECKLLGDNLDKKLFILEFQVDLLNDVSKVIEVAKEAYLEIKNNR